MTNDPKVMLINQLIIKLKAVSLKASLLLRSYLMKKKKQYLFNFQGPLACLISPSGSSSFHRYVPLVIFILNLREVLSFFLMNWLIGPIICTFFSHHINSIRWSAIVLRGLLLRSIRSGFIYYIREHFFCVIFIKGKAP